MRLRRVAWMVCAGVNLVSTAAATAVGESATSTAVQPTAVEAPDAPRTLRRRSTVKPDDGRAIEAAAQSFHGERADFSAGPFSLAWPMCAVLGLIGLGVFVVRKWLPNGSALSAGGAGIQVLSRQHLSAKQSLCLVKIGHRIVLVGLTPERLSTLCEIRNPDEAAALASMLEQAKPSSFTAMFGKLTSREAAAEQLARDEGKEPDRPSRDRGQDCSHDSIRGLMERVRSLSLGMKASAEPI